LTLKDYADASPAVLAGIDAMHETDPEPEAASGACCGDCECAATAGAQARALSHRAALLGRGGSGQDTSALPWIGDEFEE
jgi:hypothetical protein